MSPRSEGLVAIACSLVLLGFIAFVPQGSDQSFFAFVPTVGPRQPAPAARLQGLARPELPSSQSTSGAAVAGLAVLLGALAARFGQSQRDSSRVTRFVRGFHGKAGLSGHNTNKYRPGQKGKKPFVSQYIAKNVWKATLRKEAGRETTLAEVEEKVKRTLFGTVQAYFTTKNWNWCVMNPEDGVKRSKRFNPAKWDGDHKPQDPKYNRMWLEPAKFKKVELLDWEMPEHYPSCVTLSELTDAGMQYGHRGEIWNPYMFKYIYADFDGTHIFDLVQTAANLNRACFYAMDAAAKGAKFMFVSTKEQAKEFIETAAERTGSSYATDLYIAGTITNAKMIQHRVKLLKNFHEEKEQGAWADLGSQNDRCAEEYVKLTKKFPGLWDYKDLPDIVICIDQFVEKSLVQECHISGIPCICLCDNNNNPSYVDMVVPGNASSTRSISLFIEKITDAIVRGQVLRRSTPPGEYQDIPREWDPWLFSSDRIRRYSRKALRQDWQKQYFGSYEQYKRAHPLGRLPTVPPFKKFDWKDDFPSPAKFY